jgi:hypothetical protein
MAAMQSEQPASMRYSMRDASCHMVFAAGMDVCVRRCGDSSNPALTVLTVTTVLTSVDAITVVHTVAAGILDTKRLVWRDRIRHAG